MTCQATGTFSFTLAAEWDFIPQRKAATYCANAYSISINDRLNMRKAVQLLLDSGNWEPYKAVADVSRQNLFLTTDTNRTKSPLFNEYLYFNTHMRRLVYNQTDFAAFKGHADYARALDDRGDAMVVLRRKPPEDGSYAYYLYRRMTDTNAPYQEYLREYRLPVSSIELRLYAVGVMLLTIRCQREEIDTKADGGPLAGFYTRRDLLRNERGKACNIGIVNDSDDLSWIENCGRRLFASRPVDPEDKKELSSFCNDFPVLSAVSVGAPRDPFCPDHDWRERSFILCDHVALLTPACKHACTPPEHLDFVSGLIAPHCISKPMLKAGPAVKHDVLVLDSYNDDRMYLHGTIVSNEISRKTCDAWEMRGTAEGLEALKRWYGILFADGGWCATCNDQQVLRTTLEASTDARWVTCGTLHGMTYHSMLMLVSAGALGYLYVNNDWIYLQMFLIAVLQRCAIQRFYREASGLLQTRAVRSDGFRAAVQDKYTLVLNQVWFYEVTEQEQGKEMFSKLQQVMNVGADVEFLDRALDELHQQAENRTAGMINKLLMPISILGGLWSLVELVTLPEKAHPALHWLLIVLIVFIGISALIYFCNQIIYLWRRFARPFSRGCRAKKHAARRK